MARRISLRAWDPDPARRRAVATSHESSGPPLVLVVGIHAPRVVRDLACLFARPSPAGQPRRRAQTLWALVRPPQRQALAACSTFPSGHIDPLNQPLPVADTQRLSRRRPRSRSSTSWCGLKCKLSAMEPAIPVAACLCMRYGDVSHHARPACSRIRKNMMPCAWEEEARGHPVSSSRT